MATIDFPAELPLPSRSGYEINHVSPFQRTEMRTGRARQRRTFQNVPSECNLQFRFNEPQAQVFEGWFAYEITDGADWFNIDLKTPIGNIAPYECRFMEMYSGPRLDNSNYWNYTARVEIRERPILTRDWYIYGKEFVLGSSIIDIALNDKWPEA